MIKLKINLKISGVVLEISLHRIGTYCGQIGSVD